MFQLTPCPAAALYSALQGFKIAANLHLPPSDFVLMHTQETMTSEDKHMAWNKLLSRHNLKDNPTSAAYDKLFPWTFADFNFTKDYDFFQSVQKLRKAGFNSMKLDTAEMYVGWMKELDQLGVMPPIGAGRASNSSRKGWAEAPAGGPGPAAAAKAH